jgi:VanZ family protein
VVLLLSLYVLFWPDPAGDSGLPGADKVVHLVLFGLLAATTRLRFGGHWRLLALLAGYALVSELVQASLLPERSGDVADLVADMVGVAAGWWLTGRAAQDRPVGPGRRRSLST